MKRKILTYIFLIGLLSSCEKTIEIESLVPSELTIFALASAGQPFRACISHNLPVSGAPDFYYLEYADFCRLTKSYFTDNLVVKDADATLSVNGNQTYKLSLDTASFTYTCDYVAAEGDELKLTVVAAGYPTATSVTKVEKALELLDLKCDVLYDEATTAEGHEFGRRFHGYDPYGADSVAVITFTFNDPGQQRNYYRLKVRSVGEFPSLLGDRTLYTVVDAFTSVDPIFHDKQLIKGYGDWQPFMTNVFDDYLFDGKEYTTTVTSRMRNEVNNYIILELQSISPELYYYLKSFQLYRISTDDVYGTPIGLYCNIDAGWGIFGSVCAVRYIVR